MRIYLDNCAIQRPLDDPSQLRIRAEADAILDVLALCVSEDLSLVVSDAHTIEIEKCPYPDRVAFVEDVLALSTAFAPTDPSTQSRADAYEASGLRRLDAIHLASAVEARTAFFCTTDDRLLKRGRALDTGSTAVVSPLELLLVL